MLDSWLVRRWMTWKVRHSDRLQTECRLRTLISLWSQVLRRSRDHDLCAINSFQLGCIHFGRTGDGEQAGRLFRQTVEHSLETSRRSRRGATLLANACENLMILSLSYEEWDHWANLLTQLQPDNYVLTVHVPRTRLQRDRGWPWAVTMDSHARLFAGGEHLHEAGPHQLATACAILQRILAHRDELRLSRTQWRMAVDGYATLALQIAAHCDLEMRRATPHYDGKEFSFVLRDAVPVAEEYLDTCPADTRVRQSLDQLRRGVQLAENYGARHVSSSRRSALSDAYTDTGPSDEFYWRSRPELNAAVVALGLSGLRFELRDVAVVVERNTETEFRALALTFAPVEPPLVKDRRAASLALRCIAGLSLPAVVASGSDIGVALSDRAQYSVKLHTGVPMYAYVLRFRNLRYGPLQVLSRNEGHLSVALLAPIMVNEESVANEQVFLDRLRGAFERHKGSVVTLFEALPRQ